MGVFSVAFLGLEDCVFVTFWPFLLAGTVRFGLPPGTGGPLELSLAATCGELTEAGTLAIIPSAGGLGLEEGLSCAGPRVGSVATYRYVRLPCV